jgi:hypothetical protein
VRRGRGRKGPGQRRAELRRERRHQRTRSRSFERMPCRRKVQACVPDPRRVRNEAMIMEWEGARKSRGGEQGEIGCARNRGMIR